MCVLAFAWRPNSRWWLVAAGNRDELHSRPAASLMRWDEQPRLLAGRDMLSGGTWMGVSEEGRFAVVTNIRSEAAPDPDLESRGALVVRLLTEPNLRLEAGLAARFNAFNMISADGEDATFFANRPAFQRRSLASGVYGLANADLDAPWPKTVRLRSGMEDWLADDEAGAADLLELLAEGREMPLDPSAEAHLSPVFMRNIVYGTRCSTVVLIDTKGHGAIVERSYSPEGAVTNETELTFRWPS